MRKILFSVFAGGIILLGCGKGSDSPAGIVGTWQVNKFVEQEYANGVLIGGDTTTEGSVIFKSDGTTISTDSSGSDTSNYTYNSSSKILTISDSLETLNYHVTNLTSSNLHFNLDTTVSLYRLVFDADLKR